MSAVWHGVLDLLGGFATPYTPLSFFSGIGVHHLYCKYWRDRRDDEKDC
ncbi:hypothetical protein KHO57_gp080 [Mycobacterium phage Phabba]|uniref:Uncharacterized protein n=1 Tax=Mycobacterium phage Phabba TaxID=2027899 RepID=A0A249XSD4_9CAUD|nr:hypothetical protein KHO57_gp080 [Mycobacterium phage Phabba]ASZ74655.1 hypothetical protein SEA_PHABBA_80 [Mycobacterium phage Phabba]